MSLGRQSPTQTCFMTSPSGPIEARKRISCGKTGRDKIRVYIVSFHVFQHSHAIFRAIQTSNGESFPPHVGKYHHHIAASTTHVVGYGDSLTIPDQDIQTNQPCANAYIIIKFHISSFKYQDSREIALLYKL